MEIKFILVLSFVSVLILIGFYILIKSQTKLDKEKTFVRRVAVEGSIKKLFFHGYSWIYDEYKKIAIPGVLVYYYENNRPVRIAIPEEYFNSKYISLLEKEKEDADRS